MTSGQSTVTPGVARDSRHAVLGIRGQHRGHVVRPGQRYVERLDPSEQQQQIVASSDFGRDAIDKARAIVEKARSAIGRKDVTALKEQIEGLSRTHRMFKGVVAKPH